MGCGTSFGKYMLFFCNLVVSLLGIALIAMGVYVLVNWKVVKMEIVTAGPSGFIVIGAIMFFVAFLGCCGAIRESHCMVLSYAVFLLLLIMVQVAMAVLMFFYDDYVKDAIVKYIEASFAKDATDPISTTFINNVQEQFHCCGIKNGTTTHPKLPASCCDPSYVVNGFCESNIYPDCLYVIPVTYEYWKTPIAGIDIGFVCCELIATLFALYFANVIKNMDRRLSSYSGY